MDEALYLAYSTFKALEDSDYGKPNHVTYTTFLKACSRLIPTEGRRRKILSTVFKKCCSEGQ
eukprot:12091825-Ditylum_brightwellii.AAC.1